MRIVLIIAIKHLVNRRRQSLVSLLGIVLGVAFFLAISALMQGSEADFIRRLVDNSPHITIHDQFRNPRRQPAEELYGSSSLELRNVKPVLESRGIRGYKQILTRFRKMPGVLASPVLAGQALVSYAGRDIGITVNGMLPEEIIGVTTIERYMREGSVKELTLHSDGIIIGSELARKLSSTLGDLLSVTASTGQVRVFKVVGIFRIGRADFDEQQVFADLKRMQALLNRPHRANKIIIKLAAPYTAHAVAKRIEELFGYKTVSWQEASEDLLSTLIIRNSIMYTVVSAVLVVAGFGIYNIISTVVMEKQRDIAILKSIGFQASDIQYIFLIQGLALGLTGSILGLPLGALFMSALEQITFKPPGATEPVQMPIDWSVIQFLLASAFAVSAAVIAALLPARKAALVKPVEILRGGM